MLTVKVGQVWVDCDFRESVQRRLRVISIGRTHARVEVITARPSMHHTLGKQRMIRLDRFKPGSRGYYLEEDNEG